MKIVLLHLVDDNVPLYNGIPEDFNKDHIIYHHPDYGIVIPCKLIDQIPSTQNIRAYMVNGEVRVFTSLGYREILFSK